MGLGGGVVLVGYSAQWVGMVVEQPASRTLTCLLSAGAEIGGGRTQKVLWGLGPKYWGSLAGRPDTYLVLLLFLCL